MDTATRKRILAEAETWMYTPFHHKGRIKGVGVDCGGLIYCIYSQYFTCQPFPDDYAEDWALHQGRELYLEWIEPYSREIKAPMPGGIALFHYGRHYSHAAMVTFKYDYIHAFGRTGHGCVQRNDLSFFEGRKVRYFDVKEGLIK